MTATYFLVNSQACTFDKGTFASDAEAVRWAAGRGGSYDLLCRGFGTRGERLVASWRNGRRYHSPHEGFVGGSARPRSASQATDRIFFEMGNNVCYIEVPSSDGGVWEAIEAFDEAHGTDLWDRLSERDVLGVNLDGYRRPEKVIGFADRTYRGEEARRILSGAQGMYTWGEDTEHPDDDRYWYAEQRGVSPEGWPFTVHYRFRQGFEPADDDRDFLDHIAYVVVTEPLDPVRRSASKASKPKSSVRKTTGTKSKGARR